MCIRDSSTAPGPRIPNPTNPTRTTSIVGMVKPNTLFWPDGRSGVSITMVPLSHFQESPELTVCAVVVCGKQPALFLATYPMPSDAVTDEFSENIPAPYLHLYAKQFQIPVLNYTPAQP